jgi:hypothetical protein
MASPRLGSLRSFGKPPFSLDNYLSWMSHLAGSEGSKAGGTGIQPAGPGLGKAECSLATKKQIELIMFLGYPRYALAKVR